MNKKNVLIYKNPAEDSDIGWERQSLPLGNGYMGANVFGGLKRERIQFTSNEYANPLKRGGLNNFAEIYIELNHENAENYLRGLDMNNGVAFCSYKHNSYTYKREYFCSYPDNCFVAKFECDEEELDFTVKMSIPYLNTEKDGEEIRKTGCVAVDYTTFNMRGTLPLHSIIFEAILYLDTDGLVVSYDDRVEVENATYAYFYYVQGTNYKLNSKVFLEKDDTKKAIGEDPKAKVQNLLKNALNLSYSALYEKHIEDFSKLFSRVELNLTDNKTDIATDKLLTDYRNDDSDLHIEELYYQFGRYLLISSSRPGTLPSSLQGVWNVHDKSPWGCGYWHNINVQMNYWPAFTTNLAETFEPFADFVKAYLPRAQELASEYIKSIVPENYVEGQGECGWAIGTGSNAYTINPPESHSGPGTGGLTASLFWDYYDFTRDADVLKNTTYPITHNMAKYLTKCVKNYDGRYLTVLSASPEQSMSRYWITPLGSKQMYYHTVGCAFDQQMIYENGKNFLMAADILGIKDETYMTQSEQIDKYDPVHIGRSGQIKEFEEEHFYGEICEANHRHISHLMALMPGNLINSNTPAWVDAAKKTLLFRGDESTGWALAHRFCAWSRTGDGEHAYLLFKNMIKNRTYNNLWDWHPPFQIDGNFGAVAGVTEMLLQSHEGYIHILPSLPSAWKKGDFKGLKARGNFTVNCKWKDLCAENIEIISNIGGKLSVKYKNFDNDVTVVNNKNQAIDFKRCGDIITFETKKGCTYNISGFKKYAVIPQVNNLQYKKEGNRINLTWSDFGKIYRIYKAINDAPDYDFVCETEKSEYVDTFDNNNYIQTYKVTAYDGENFKTESDSTTVTVHNATQLEFERYLHKFRQNNL